MPTARKGRIDPDIVRQRLEARRHDLEKIRDSAEESVADSQATPSEGLAGYDQHQADAASDMFERERALSIAEMAVSALQDIEEAERRLEDGTYGTCEVCGKPIDEERLEARPEARFCVEHAPPTT